MLEVVQQYRALLTHIPPAQAPGTHPPSPRAAFAHVHYMLEKMESEFLNPETFNEKTWDKANRWLGFLQGVFWMQGTYTLEQMKDQNRTAPKKMVRLVSCYMGGRSLCHCHEGDTQPAGEKFCTYCGCSWEKVEATVE